MNHLVPTLGVMEFHGIYTEISRKKLSVPSNISAKSRTTIKIPFKEQSHQQIVACKGISY